MATLSVCMIVKNEEQWLPKSLESIKNLADEIIIVDTGSTDKTKEIAKTYNAKIFDFKWDDDYADARNFSISKATSDWILWLDADETVSKKDHNYFKQIMKEEKFPIVVLEQRHYTNDKKNPQFKPVDDRYKKEAMGFEGYYPTLITRMFKNNMGLKFEGKVHETIDKSMQKLGLKFLRTDIPIHHYQNFKSDTMTKEKKEKYEKLLKEKENYDPSDLKNLHDLAVTHLQKNDLKKSFSYFRKIYDLDEGLLEPYLGMGIIWAKRGDYKRAIKFFLTAISKDTKKSIELTSPVETIRETILFNLAMCFLRTGEKPKAMQIFKDMIRLGSRFTPQIQDKLKELGISSNVKAS